MNLSHALTDVTGTALVQVVWVTATMPYVVLSILLARGVFLEGALDGMRFFITPNFSRLNDPAVSYRSSVQPCTST